MGLRSRDVNPLSRGEGKRRRHSKPQVVSQTTPENLPKPVSSKPVLLSLLGLPLILTLGLTLWLGTPKEQVPVQQAFAKLGIPAVPAVRVESLAYNRLFFVRLDLEEGPRRDFLRNLTDFEVSRGVPEKPIALKLERTWWDPPLDQEGMRWTKGDVTVWNADSRPETFYIVLATPVAGGAESDE